MGFGNTTTKGKTFPVEILTRGEVRALMNATSNRGLCGVRDRALIGVLYRAGLRIGEALAMLPKDLDLTTGIVNVLRGKGSKQRVVAIDAEAVALVRHWMDTRRAEGIKGTAPLFCTLKGTVMNRVQVTQHLKALASKAGVDKRVHAHAFRHSLSVELIEEEHADIRVIQAALGHSSIATTQTYINHLRPRAVIDTMSKRTW
jgi:site-specific recombinase XerD